MKNKLSILIIIFSILISFLSSSYAHEGGEHNNNFEIYADSNSYSLCSCGASSYNLFVENTDFYEKSFLVKIEGEASGFVSLSEELFLLKSGEQRTVNVIVAMPCSLYGNNDKDNNGNEDTKVNILVESEGETKVIEQEITIKKCSNYDIYTEQASITATFCNPVVYNITLVNNKDFIEYVDLYVDEENVLEEELKSELSLSENTVILFPNQPKKFSLSTIPQCDEHGEKEFVLTSKSRNTGVVKELNLYLNMVEEKKVSEALDGDDERVYKEVEETEDESESSEISSSSKNAALNSSLLKSLVLLMLIEVIVIGVVELVSLSKLSRKKESRREEKDIVKKADDSKKAALREHDKIKVKQIEGHKLFKKEEGDKKHKKRKLWLIIPLLAFLVIFLVLFGVYTFTKPTEDVNATTNETQNQTDLIDDNVKVIDENEKEETKDEEINENENNVSVYDKYEDYNFGNYSREFIIKEMNKNSYYLFKLNKLFFDADNDKLKYTYETSDNFTVLITRGYAIVKPNKDYVGDGFITFKADDNKGGIAESSRFILVVNDKEQDNSNTVIVLVMSLFVLILVALYVSGKKVNKEE